MIISPPFLPERAAGQSDEQWLDVAMRPPRQRLPDTQAPEGSFPLGLNLAWHNGMHLQAPQAAGRDLPVRAIADGRVIFANPATRPNASPDDPQNYNPFARAGEQTPAWTDNGCVIVEHRTTIGADGDTETEVVFYSLYMHLSSLARITPQGQTTARELQTGDAIWRKDEVGQPGQIYGSAGQIHFEICFDAANLQRLIGRAPAWVEPAVAPAVPPAPTADGRTDSVFGSLYFYLPANTPTATGAAMPASHLRVAAPATTLGTPIWVKMTYDRGACTFETYDERGTLIAALPAEPEGEYALYDSAVARHGSLSAAQRAQSSPSGWFELLRFGRNLGRGPAAADRDPLPADAAHWRRIAGANGQAVWADLNAAGSFKFSDADFLPVMGWNCIDDDTSPLDQRCDSEQLKRFVADPATANEQRMEPAELARRLGREDVQSRLTRLICKFPSEWDRATVVLRYQFVQELDGFKNDTNAWPKLKAHLEAIGFVGLPAAYLAADRHAHPKAFVAVWRRNGWLSQAELALVYPDARYPVRVLGLEGRGRTPASIRDEYRLSVNRSLRKYQVQTPARMTHFFGQGAVESMYLVLMVEGSAAFSRNPAHASFQPEGGGFYVPAGPNDYLFYLENRLGNIEPGDGPKFRGRGMKQLTGRENYSKYWVYRGWISQDSFRTPWWNPSRPAIAPQIPDPQRLSVDAFNAIDAGGWYWLAGAASNQFRSINSIITTETIDRASVRSVARAINGINRQTGDPNGLAERLVESENVRDVLMDAP